MIKAREAPDEAGSIRRVVSDTSSDPRITRHTYGSDPEQFGELRVPSGPGPHPAVIYIHGGGWSSAVTLAGAMGICAALTEQGYATWSVEYRRAGNGGGWTETFDDIKNGAAHLQTLAEEHNIDLERVCVAGQSAGGQLALWLARQKTGNPLLRGAMGLAPATDLRSIGEREPDHALVIVMGGQPSTHPDRYAAAAPLEILPLGLPQLIVHGTADSIVPYAMSEKYVAAARAAGDSVEFVAVEGADHLDLWNRASPAFPKVVAAADRFLNKLIGSQVSANEPQHAAAER